MHQSTQRRICRLVFLIGCILPTLAVMAWATVERLPSTAAARLTAVEHLLGMHVAAETIQTPKPGVFRASEVTLTNVETGAEVLLARLATIRPQTTATFVELSGVQVAAGELPLLAATVQRALAVDWPGDVRIQVANAAWLGESPAAGAALLASGPLTLTLRTNQHQGEVLGRELAVRLGDATSGPRFTAVRNRQLVPTATRISIHTAGQLVPAGWIAQLGGMVAAGKQASFAGEATITHTAGDTSGELSGTLSDVTLAVATQLPIDTRARIENLQAQWSSGRLIRAQGIVRAGPGSMAGSLARMLQPLLYEPQHPQPGAQVGEAESLEFAQLAVTFVCDHKSLSFWGACPSADPQAAPCVLDADEQALFGPPHYCASLTGVATVLDRCGTEHAAEVVARLPRATQR